MIGVYVPKHMIQVICYDQSGSGAENTRRPYAIACDTFGFFFVSQMMPVHPVRGERRKINEFVDVAQCQRA